MRQIFLDTETTGLDPAQGHRLIEIAAVEMINRKHTNRHFHAYVNPEREIDAEAERVHGTSLDFLQDKPKFANVADEFLAFVEGAELIIHNAPFDIGFLNAELKRIGRQEMKVFCPSVIDTLVMAKDVFPGKRNSLDALCDRFEIDRSNRTLHGALIDCELLGDVYLALTRGQDSLLMDFGSHSHGGASHGGKPRRECKAAPRVRYATEQELAQHADYLADLDKNTKGDCLWLKMTKPDDAAVN